MTLRIDFLRANAGDQLGQLETRRTGLIDRLRQTRTDLSRIRQRVIAAGVGATAVTEVGNEIAAFDAAIAAYAAEVVAL